jgi:glutathione S-transferase
MIQLYREPLSPEGDQVEAALRGMAVGYQRVDVTPADAASLLGADVSLPAVKDGDQVTSGRAALLEYLDDLEQFFHDWHTYQGDACYVRDDREC